VVLLSSVGVLFYQSSENLINEYDDSFERFLMLNDISQRTTIITENLKGYLLDKESSYLKTITWKNLSCKMTNGYSIKK
jgi:CHASE3 domain sensor protein